jgi:hydroxyacylglutathione hydrolase
MAAEIEQFICRSDNFGVLLHDPSSGVTASIDAPEEAAIRAALERRGWRLTHVLTTHHHGDHTEVNAALKAAFGATIVGPAAEAEKIPGIEKSVREGDMFTLGALAVGVIETPGHTLGHVSYHLPEEGIAFTGDALFSLGCGRVFEGTMEGMWESLKKLRALPRETIVYCGHEYTEANARFALTIEPNNLDLEARAEEVSRLRAAGKPTLPTTIGAEITANPFLRADRPRLRAAIDMRKADPAEVFAALRSRKDAFRG